MESNKCLKSLSQSFEFRFSVSRASKILTEMRSTFGPNDCQLLCINSSEDGRIERQDNPWASHVSYSCKDQIFFFFSWPSVCTDCSNYIEVREAKAMASFLFLSFFFFFGQKSDASPSKHLGSFLNNDDFSEVFFFFTLCFYSVLILYS